MCVCVCLCFHSYCSAQLSMFNMEMRKKNKIIISTYSSARFYVLFNSKRRRCSLVTVIDSRAGVSTVHVNLGELVRCQSGMTEQRCHCVLARKPRDFKDHSH